MTSAAEQLSLLTRGIVDLHQRAELESRLAAGKPLRVKAGFDPTRPDLHLGHTVLMQKMAQFQALGHTVIFLVGDFTAMVGDPTGRNDLRPPLTRDEVMAAAQTYQAQAFKILDKDKTEVRFNSEWLETMKPSAMVELCGKYTVARMLERDDFSKRYKEERPIHVHEFLYPLLQGYDSVALNSDIELGGTDQLFNLLVGRDLMPRYGMTGQMVMTMPLLEGLNAKVENGKIVGAKMSKSANNYVGITESPTEMFNKLMVIDDQVIWRYLDLLSAKGTEELRELRRVVEAGGESVIKVKEAFAAEIVTRFHSADEARAAVERRHAVSKGAMPDDIAEIVVQAEGDSVLLSKAMMAAGFAKSSSEGMRLIKGGGVKVDSVAMTNDRHALPKGTSCIVQAGGKNKRFVKFRVE